MLFSFLDVEPCPNIPNLLAKGLLGSKQSLLRQDQSLAKFHNDNGFFNSKGIELECH
jgi:hypothetical protein